MMTEIPDPRQFASDFHKDGFVAVRPLFDDAEIKAVNQEVARFIRDVVPSMPKERVYYEDRADKRSLKQLQRIFEYDSYFRNLMLDGPPRVFAETVLGENVVPVNMQYFNKPPGIGKPTPPHQDGYYFHLTPCQAVTGWLALEDADAENGCVHYVRGSHRADGFRRHGATGVLGFSQGIVDFGTAEDRAETVAMPGAAGTFLMHDAKTIHWAGPNRSHSRSRRALGFIYYAASARIDAAARDAYQSRLDSRLKDGGQI